MERFILMVLISVIFSCCTDQSPVNPLSGHTWVSFEKSDLGFMEYQYIRFSDSTAEYVNYPRIGLTPLHLPYLQEKDHVLLPTLIGQLSFIGDTILILRVEHEKDVYFSLERGVCSDPPSLIWARKMLANTNRNYTDEAEEEIRRLMWNELFPDYKLASPDSVLSLDDIEM